MLMRPLRMPDPSSIVRTWVREYPQGVPERYEYPLVSLARFLDDAAQDFPETAAIECMGAELDYGRLLDHADRLAAALQLLGLRRGDMVGIVLPNCPQHIIVLAALYRVGATAVEIDPGAEPGEMGRRLAETGARAVVFIDSVYESLERLVGRLPALEHVIASGLADYLPFPRNVLTPLLNRRDGAYAKLPKGGGVLRLADLIKRSPPVFVQTEIDPEKDIAAIVYTRGERPKGAALSHLNLVANAFQLRLWIPDVQAGRERLLCAAPLSSAWGLTALHGAGLLSGSTVLMVPQLDRLELLKVIDGRRPTLMIAESAVIDDLLDGDDLGRFDLSSLRVCLTGGRPLSPQTAHAFEEQTGVRLRETYGLTEAGPFTHANPVYGRSKPGSIGLPISDTICMVVDQREPTQPVEPGRAGELAIHGPQVMRGYWNRASDTAATLKDGWLLTGDIVEVDEDGYFHLVDQKRDAVRVGDREVYPRDVEAVLLRHPKVSKAAVAGIPEFAGDDMLKAYLVLEEGQTATSTEIDEFCREQLAPHQVPQRYEFRRTLPATPPGKPMREALIAEEESQLG